VNQHHLAGGRRSALPNVKSWTCSYFPFASIVQLVTLTSLFASPPSACTWPFDQVPGRAAKLLPSGNP